ncbi:uncharacterized protein LOC129773499 [Toxorhynchites rutilus septentrionalis]|uniref:uncharacterized protein LOC129773499 n=1 Tax=Toxorhynchites rutilus septentrionalis TaxID=329112 RepID=UPI002479969E|nr:uncharacterized protein LOC129773499 [Toxorhynchites rutilus septentrionalis]XP_055633095.1 uncharacterized protein LOC129773499 [Toxorhynchites rutilus septentrionalis]
MVTTRLDSVTQRGWEEFSATQEQDTLQDLLDFLQRRLQVLDSLPTKAAKETVQHQQQSQTRSKPSIARSSYNAVQISGVRCVICAAEHILYQCVVFQRMSVSEREKILHTNNLCRNCLKPHHRARICPSKYSCRNCKGRHHTLVCFKEGKGLQPRVEVSPRSTKQNNLEGKRGPSTRTSSQVVNLAANEVAQVGRNRPYSTQVLLATAVVVVEDDDGNRFSARALLDSGSESNFLSERLSKRLKVDRDRVDFPVQGIDTILTTVKQRVKATICSRAKGFSRKMGFLVLPTLTAKLPTTAINTSGWSIPENIQLADPLFAESFAIDIIIGMESFFDLFESGRKMTPGEGKPTLHESVFGWVVCGGMANPNMDKRRTCSVATQYTSTIKRSSDWKWHGKEATNEYVSYELGEANAIAYWHDAAMTNNSCRLKNSMTSTVGENLRFF